MCHDCVLIWRADFLFFLFFFLNVFVNSSAGFLKNFLSCSFGHWWLFHSFSVLVLDHFQKSILFKPLDPFQFFFLSDQQKQCQRQLFDCITIVFFAVTKWLPMCFSPNPGVFQHDFQCKFEEVGSGRVKNYLQSMECIWKSESKDCIQELMHLIFQLINLLLTEALSEIVSV